MGLRKTPSSASQASTTHTKYSVRSRVITGLTIIVIAFSSLIGYSIILYRQTVAELSLINTTYLPLTLGTSDIRATQLVFNTLMDRLSDEANQSITRDWIDAARRYRPTTLKRLVRVINKTIADDIPDNESAFLQEIKFRLIEVERRYRRNEIKFSRLYVEMDSGHMEEATQQMEALKRSERLLDKVLKGIGTEVDRHITELSEEAETNGINATYALAIMSLIALLVGIAVVITTTKLLAPLKKLMSAVVKVSQGDLNTHIKVEQQNEIGQLAASFNTMTDALCERDERLIRSERLATTGKMAAQVTHEIRNPLTSLGLNAELLEEDLANGAPAAETKKLLGAMQDEIERLTQITEAYLRFARLPTPTPDYDHLSKTINASIAFMKNEFENANISISTNLDETIPPLLFDRSQIRQALVNLLKNASEALPFGGKISVTTKLKTPNWVALIVSDNGPGIPKEFQEKVFDSFYTTKSAGTGLGLPLVRQICIAHGGDVEYDSTIQKGSRFIITLPIQTHNPQHTKRNQ